MRAFSKRRFLKTLAGFGATATMSALPFRTVAARPKRIVYLTPGLDLPFWRYLSRAWKPPPRPGAMNAKRWTRATARKSSSTTRKTPSRAAWRVWSYRPRTPRPRPASLQGQRREIPVVIADIGANEGEYLFSSAPTTMSAPMTWVRRWPPGCGKEAGRTALSAYQPSRRPARTARRAPGASWTACAPAAQGRQASLQQMQAYTAEETFRYTQDMLAANPDLRALFVQTDQPTIGALRAIKVAVARGRC